MLNNIVNNIVKNQGTIWAAKYCSSLFSSTLLQVGRFLQCNTILLLRIVLKLNLKVIVCSINVKYKRKKVSRFLWIRGIHEISI
jgi:hypothetical protein